MLNSSPFLQESQETIVSFCRERVGNNCPKPGQLLAVSRDVSSDAIMSQVGGVSFTSTQNWDQPLPLSLNTFNFMRWLRQEV